MRISFDSLDVEVVLHISAALLEGGNLCHPVEELVPLVRVAYYEGRTLGEQSMMAPQS